MAASRICSIANCDKTHYAKGFCQAHYERSRRHGDPFAGRTAEGEPEKFLREVVLPYDGDECVLWPFARNGGGYGQIVVGSRLRRVSRLVCEDVNGPPPHCKPRSRTLLWSGPSRMRYQEARFMEDSSRKPVG